MKILPATLSGLVVAAIVAAGLILLPSPEGGRTGRPGVQRVVREGIAVEFSIGDGSQRNEPALLAGNPAAVHFRIADATTGEPVRGLRPGAWVDPGIAASGRQGVPQSCKERVGLYLKRMVGVRPMIDLNSYFLLVLNRDPSISVIDPLVGVTGRTSLFTSILLPAPGADWTEHTEKRRLYVSMPTRDAVAVVDSSSFQLLEVVEAGPGATRVALQPDGRHLWVGIAGGVAAIDTETNRRVATVATGDGYHEIAFDGAERWAFVSNRESGTVTAIDLETHRVAAELRTGPLPLSIAYSPLSDRLFVADGRTGEIAVVDTDRLQVTGRIRAEPGLGPMRITPDGRFGLVLNTLEHIVHVFDTANGRLVHRIPMPGRPYQIVTTRTFAYVRLFDSERVQMIELRLLAGETTPPVASFPAGSRPPILASELALADSIAPVPTEAAVFVTDPADNATYYYMEGMNAPMGSFSNYGHATRAVRVVNRSLQEIEPGHYVTHMKIPQAGQYEVAFLLDTPRVLHCFRFEAAENPALRRRGNPAEVEWLAESGRLVAPGETVSIRFRLRDGDRHEPLVGLPDVRIRAWAAPGDHRTEVAAREIEPGLYEARLAFAAPGAWYLHVGSARAKVRFGELPYLGLQVSALAARKE